MEFRSIVIVSFILFSIFFNRQINRFELSKTIIKRETKALSETDTLAVLKAFEASKTNKLFLKDLGLQHEKQFNWNHNPRHIIFGDIDHDGISDALFGFTIENRGGGNNSDFHYAVFLQTDQQWKYSGQLDASIFSEGVHYVVKNINDGEVLGFWRSDFEAQDRAYKATFKYIDKHFVNTYTQLHYYENSPPSTLFIEGITYPFQNIPLLASSNIYQKLLGDGTIETPVDQPGCGTYWEEKQTRYLHFKHLSFELNRKNKATWILINITNSETIVHTNIGTMSKKTKIQELKNIFTDEENWSVNEDGNKFLIIRSSNSDELLFLYFSNNGYLQRIERNIQC